MTSCAAWPQAEMTVTGLSGSATLTVLAWQSAVAVARPGHAWPIAGWQYVAALAGRCPTARLEIADVIICAYRLQHSGAAGWLGATLGRYPGCAVAAAGTGGLECLVGTRDGPPVTFAAGACADVGEPGWLELLCASFVHGWLAGGRPFAELGSTLGRVTAFGAPKSWRLPVHGGVVSYSLGVVRGSASGPRASSRCRICPSSGAPTSA